MNDPPPPSLLLMGANHFIILMPVEWYDPCI
jgi:hypothetical protein